MSRRRRPRLRGQGTRRRRRTPRPGGGSFDHLLGQFEGSLVEEQGLDPVTAKLYAAAVREFQRETGIDFTKLTREELECLEAVFEREFEKLDREEPKN
jgi:hypothetical protein